MFPSRSNSLSRININKRSNTTAIIVRVKIYKYIFSESLLNVLLSQAQFINKIVTLLAIVTLGNNKSKEI